MDRLCTFCPREVVVCGAVATEWHGLQFYTGQSLTQVIANTARGFGSFPCVTGAEKRSQSGERGRENKEHGHRRTGEQGNEKKNGKD